ncbi:MAG: accessory Sec system protein Asp2 [Burkholderiales bacterium]|nr:accessory Sec system protein Asp2 [Burkholderiales bacterium]
MSYYAFSESLSANVLHIVDNFGSHGSYLYSFVNKEIQESVYELIKSTLSELEITLNNTFFVGTSKGGFCSIYYSLLFGGGHVIAGEPQIKLGDFLFRKNWERNEDCKSIIYAMSGRVNKSDQDLLNDILYNLKVNHGNYTGSVTIHYGKNTGYYNSHIKFVNDVFVSYGISTDILNFVEHDISSHNDIIPIFMDEIKKINRHILKNNIPSSTLFQRMLAFMRIKN